MKTIILKKANRFLVRSSGWNEKNAELDDFVLDFIAPLFARNTAGEFYELRKVFQAPETASESELKAHLYGLLHNVFHQESIRIFQLRDQVGCIFYRSLRYIMSKHPGWSKTEINGAVRCITRTGITLVADFQALEMELTSIGKKQKIFIKQLESLLQAFIDTRQTAVPLAMALQLFRQRLALTEGVYSAGQVKEDPLFKLEIQHIIDSVVKEIDQGLLQKYTSKGKLAAAESLAYQKALTWILHDLADGGIHQTYCTYLNNSLAGTLDKNSYKHQHRVQFEYAAKLAKQLFSAQAARAFNISLDRQ